MTHDLNTRIARLEAKTSHSKGVVGIVHGRGQAFDPAAQALLDQQVAVLHGPATALCTSPIWQAGNPQQQAIASLQPPRN